MDGPRRRYWRGPGPSWPPATSSAHGSHHCHCFDWVMKFRLCIYVQVPTHLNDAAVDRRTHVSRRWSWRRTSSSTATCLAVDASSCLVSCRSPSVRSRSGFRTVVWKRSERFRPYVNWMRQTALSTCVCRPLRHPLITKPRCFVYRLPFDK